MAGLSASRINNFLIVEKDANDAYLIDRALRADGRGQTTFVCRNTIDAKTYLLGDGLYADRITYPLPDLVITGLRMITDSAAELVGWIRAQQSLVHIPVVVLMGSSSPAEFAAAATVGAQRIVEKPCKFNDLRTLLTTIANDFE